MAATIMVVDDKRDNVHLLESILVKSGYRVLAFVSPHKALKALDIELPNLIMLDINMPEMDGYELAAKAKKLSTMNKIPIIFVSAYQDVDIKTKAFSHGGVDYVTKPFNAFELLARVAVHINLQQLQEKQDQHNEELQAANAKLADNNRQLEALNWELESANYDLELLSSTSRRFLFTISDEIQDSVNASTDIIGKLLTSVLDAEQKNSMHALQGRCNNIVSLLKDILEYAKMQSGKLQVEYVDFELMPMIDECCKLFANRALSNNIDFLLNTASVSFLRIKADTNHIKQVLVNLLSNAFKFTEKGHITLSVNNVDNKQLRFELEDSGIGMSEDTAGLAFNAFFQAENELSQSIDGVGIGLTTCKQLLEAMGGSIGVTSKIGEGSSFWFTLPLVLSDDPLAQHHTLMLQDKSLLFIHTNKHYRRQIQQHCTAWGIEVHTIDNLQQLPSDIDRYDWVLIADDKEKSLEESLSVVKSVRAQPNSLENTQYLLVSERHQTLDVNDSRFTDLGISAIVEQPLMMGSLYQQLTATFNH